MLYGPICRLMPPRVLSVMLGWNSTCCRVSPLPNEVLIEMLKYLSSLFDVWDRVEELPDSLLDGRSPLGQSNHLTSCS